MILALLAAVGGALAYGTGSVLQAAGAQRAAEGGGGLHRIAIQLPYLGGLGCDLGGWLLSLLALGGLPLFAVQAILASSLAVTVVLGAVVLRSTLPSRDLALVAVTVAALVVIGSSAGPENPKPVAHWIGVALLLGVPVLAGGAFAAARWAGAVATGTLAGLAFGFAAIAARALQTKGGLGAVVTDPQALAVIAYGGIGLLAYAHALGRGNVATVTAALWVSEIVAPGAVGILLLGDQVRSGWLVPAAVATAVAVVATVSLAKSGAWILESAAPEI